MKKLKIILQSSYLYYYFLASFLLIISLHYNIFIIFLLIYLFIFKKRYNKLILMFLFLIIILLFKNEQLKTIPQTINNQVLITDVEKPFNNYILTVKHKNNKYLIETKENYKIGNYLYVKGEISEFIDLSSPNAFVKSKHYKKMGIYGEILNYEIIKSNKQNYLYKLRSLIDDELLLMFLGSNPNSELNESLSNLNIYYLIGLSGIHIYFLISLMKRLLFNLDVNKNIQDVFVMLATTLLLLISGFTITLIRITIYESLKLLKKQFYNNVTNYSLLNLTYFIMILLSPHLLFNDSLLISYLIVSLLMLFRNKINSQSIFISQIKTSFLVNLIILPFSNKINIITIILNPFFIILIVYLMFPLAIINAVYKFDIIGQLINKVESVVIEVGKLNYNLLLPSLNIYLIIIYFIVLICFLIFNNYKKQTITFIMLIIVLITPYFKVYFYQAKLYFLDVGQGSSSVYISRENVVVIDAFRNVSALLKYEGIHTIDYLILTHSHLDHSNEANNLLKDYQVNYVILSMYENYSLNTDSKIIYAKAGMIIKDKDITIEIIGPIKDYENSNNNSLVFIFSYNNNNILYTGDIEAVAERDLLYIYFEDRKRNIKILNVAHHGSSSSSMDRLLDEINPKIAIISVGINNKYNMPSVDVINYLNNLGTTVYRTDYDGTILYYNNEIILL